MEEDVLAAICDEMESVFLKHLGKLSAWELDSVFSRLRIRAIEQKPAGYTWLPGNRVLQKQDEQVADAVGTLHDTQQPGEGFWATAPGAADVSEGMLWVKTGNREG